MDRFCIIRDPRDAIVSWAHYVEQIRDDHVLANVEGVDVKHAEDRIATLIDILPPYIENWLDWPQYATTVRYEKLLSEPEKELVRISEDSRFDGSIAQRQAAQIAGHRPCF